MGMFDYIVCDYPLPGQAPPWLRPGHRFQTKDTPSQYMETYTIDGGGRINGPDIENFTGTIEFYSGNSVGGWGDITYTPDGEDAVDAAYEAKFVDGVLSDIRQTEFSSQPAVRSSDHRKELDRRHPAFKHPDYEGPWVNRTIYLMYGTDDKPSRVFVLAENDKNLVLRYEEPTKHYREGDFVVEHKSFGRLMFLSAEDAFAAKNWSEDHYRHAVDVFNEMTEATKTSDPTP